jgi:hypothetical protein
MIGKPWRRFLKLTKMLHAGLLHVSLLLRVARDLGLWLSLQHWGRPAQYARGPSLSDQ